MEAYVGSRGASRGFVHSVYGCFILASSRSTERVNGFTIDLPRPKATLGIRYTPHKAPRWNGHVFCAAVGVMTLLARVNLYSRGRGFQCSDHHVWFDLTQLAAAVPGNAGATPRM